jgi:hypothetical protein
MELAKEFKQQKSRNGKTIFATKHGVSVGTMYQWARNIGLGRPRNQEGKNGHGNGYSPGTAIEKTKKAPETPNAPSDVELETLRIENTVLKANLSLAIRRGYLNELTIEGTNVSR